MLCIINWRVFIAEHTLLFRADRPHSFRLHGHGLYVVAEKRNAFIRSAEHAKKLDTEGRLARRNLDRNPVLKNTVAVPVAGVSIVRFVADNPGNKSSDYSSCAVILTNYDNIAR